MNEDDHFELIFDESDDVYFMHDIMGSMSNEVLGFIDDESSDDMIIQSQGIIIEEISSESEASECDEVQAEYELIEIPNSGFLLSELPNNDINQPIMHNRRKRGRTKVQPK